ncbi:MAG TPA: acyltransferase, partial [Nitrospiraceae bacterium]|nr:acyltransferase [Nitrospiraceae bacterium]
MQNKFFKNNFDLIRLFAAFQVAFVHVFHIMEIETTGIVRFLLHMFYLFPGVPIFFFISGFLISRSYENNSCSKEFFINRVLRLYPGLIVCVTFSIILVVLSGYLQGRDVKWFELVVLFLAKATFFQFYNPEFMRAFGDGVLNGSLWTITVEIQFYLLIPVLFFIISRRPPQCTTNCALVLLTVLFFTLNRFYAVLPDMVDKSLITKLIGVSFFPWFYIFLLGVLVQRNFEFFHTYLGGRFYLAFPLYLFSAYMLSDIGSSFGNNSNPVVVVLLIMTVFSFAYSIPTLSKKILKGNDISYGLYIYNMPVVNLLIFSGLYQKTEYGFVALVTCILL